MILGSIVVNQLRFRNIEVPDFPKTDRYSDWHKWAYPIKLALQKTSDFKLYEDFDTPVAEGKLYYDGGLWIIEVWDSVDHFTINSKSKTFERK